MARTSTLATLSLVALAHGVTAGASQVLETTGFTDCGQNSTIVAHQVDIRYDNSNRTVTFDVSGTSTARQNVSAVLNVTAYGRNIYSNSFNPCSQDTFVAQLCPVPEGSFSAQGSQEIPAKYAALVPGIAFDLPDIAAQAKLQLKSLDGGQDMACIESHVSNGKTVSVPAVSYVSAGIAAAALVLTGASAAGAALASGGSSVGGLGTLSPSFFQVFAWFQGMAANGMHSVNYPLIYRSFTKNFAFSTGLVSWPGLQSSIDRFRARTGGNLTDDSVGFLQNATLIFPGGSTGRPSEGFLRARQRALDELFVVLRERGFEADFNTSTSASSSQQSAVQQAVSGIQAYAEELSVPTSNVFMTVLLVVAIAIGAIIVGILLVKVVLEGWAMFGSFPRSLAGFRKHYWGSIGRTITSLILLLYSVWVLYCIFQFTRGDSWAAKLLAAATLAVFTGILAFFTWKIWSTARRLKRIDGDASGLYDQKSIWVKYSIFYESYKKDYWWLFVPDIAYMFAKGCALAAADGHGKVQTVAQLIIESMMLALLLWSRPYERRSGTVVSIVIQTVRVLSVACILVFVEEFGIAQTTQTVAGVVLLAVQAALTGLLALLIGWNAINACCKENPHRKRRKELGEFSPDPNRHPQLLGTVRQKGGLFSRRPLSPLGRMASWRQREAVSLTPPVSSPLLRSHRKTP